MKENDESSKYSAFKYTAYQMRVASKACEEGGHRTVAAMLRHAAEVMEREEKREYEYSVYPPEVNGVFQYRAGAELKALILKQGGISDETIIRRSVGEWEVVE